MSDLREALDFYNNAQPVSPDGPFEIVHAAARRLLAGTPIRWCSTHNREPNHAQNPDDCQIEDYTLVRRAQS